MADELTNRRGLTPDYEFELHAVGVRIPNGKVHWWIEEDSVYTSEELADLLDLVAIVLRQPEDGSDNEPGSG